MTATASAPTAVVPTRDDLLRLGSAGRPWEFIAPAQTALDLEPDDEEIRLLLMANATMLGLGTQAREQLAGLSSRARRRSDVKTMLARLDELEADEITPEARLATLQANVDVLARRDVVLGDRIEAWRALDQGRRWFRALDANTPRLRDGVWENLGDHVGAARRFIQSHLNEGETRPVVIEGIDPPWLLIELDRVAPAAAFGHCPRITIVQADEMELLDGLASADLTELLGHRRVEVLVGADAGERLDARLRERFEAQIVGPVIPLAGVRTRVTPSVESVMTRVEADQHAEHLELRRIVWSAYEGRDAAWWATRYRAATDGAEPLRVLVPTCRYSTFIQHSASDLVKAFQDAGWRAELLIEPDDMSHLSSLAYLRTIERLQPDLVVLINYTRAHIADVFPPELPFVSWMQDAMGHHYDASIGAQQTEMDFLVGHLPQELFTQFGFPRERTWRMPVVTSARTFHDGAVGSEAQRRFECEIAWVSHHSEDPASMHERLKQEVGPELAPLLDLLQPQVTAMAGGPLDELAGVKLRAATEAVVQAVRPGAEDSVTTQLFRLYARPLADRIFRHQTLAWAADIADRRSWRLRVHGRGWESHPRFGRYAAGEVEHDDDLRACYQCARVHLHMTFSNLVHQRIMECALSGGLPLCRLSSESLAPILRVMRIAAAQVDPAERDDSGDEPMVGFAMEGTEASAALAAMLRHAGADVPAIRWVRERVVQTLRDASPPPEERRADWLLGDLGDMTFSSAEQLEALIERGITDHAWRQARIEHVAARVRDRLTDDALVSRVLELVTSSLEAT